MANLPNTIKYRIIDIEADLEETEKNTSIFLETNFTERLDAIDFLGFQVMAHIESLPHANHAYSEKLLLLKLRAEKIISKLEEINQRIFQKFRDIISNGKLRDDRFKETIGEYVDLNLNTEGDVEGYDNLDLFINGLFPDEIPEQTKVLQPEMVFYQKTPSRVVFEIADKISFSNQDVFYDIGSGLGQVVILLNLLTGVTTIGIEFEPAFVDYAINCAESLKLTNVSFINTDARNADYTIGTVFFLYTPFKDIMLQQVLEMLEREAATRKITIITYGPCTLKVASLNWLQSTTKTNNSICNLAIFTS